jgi:hypothetical protein
MVIKIICSNFETVLQTIKHIVIYPTLDLSLKIIVIYLVV